MSDDMDDGEIIWHPLLQHHHAPQEMNKETRNNSSHVYNVNIRRWVFWVESSVSHPIVLSKHWILYFILLYINPYKVFLIKWFHITYTNTYIYWYTIQHQHVFFNQWNKYPDQKIKNISNTGCTYNIHQINLPQCWSALNRCWQPPNLISNRIATNPQ